MQNLKGGSDLNVKVGQFYLTINNMNVDVKNSYAKVIRTCPKERVETFWDDIYSFIRYVSISGANERFETFRREYIYQEIYNTKKNANDEFVPAYMGTEEEDYANIINFYTVLGKFYIFSKKDKKDIDKLRYTEAIKKVMLSVSVVPDTSYANKKKINTTEASNNQLLKEKYTVESAIVEESEAEEKTEESLEELLGKLHSLIGLDGVKNEVDQLINLVRVQKKGQELGEKTAPLSLHLVFYGNPGTGKTTVARLLAKIYKAIGVLSKGQLVETDRGGLVGGYVGQTAIKTQEVIDKAMGGILFVDEAYALTHSKGENDFGQEAVDTILKAMEDHRNDFIVIVAGYPDLMKEFISSNPGLKSRFNQYILFEDYIPEQLLQIFRLLCSEQNLKLDEACERYALQYFTNLYNKRSEDYANGRDVRNYFEKMIKMRANRLSAFLEDITVEEYRRITVSDLEIAAELKNHEW